MIDAARLRDMMNRRDISQAELARRIGVSQATVNKLAVGHSYGSKHLHKIARELATSPAYLEGETDDPDKDVAPKPPPPPPRITMDVLLPPERALAAMFRGLLKTIDPSASQDDIALQLAKTLPIGLSQLRDLSPDPSPKRPAVPETIEGPEVPATPHREPAR